MSTNFVSAVIPTYNYGRFVAEAVESALGQTHRDLEVVVVDDGSTDDTRDRLAPFMDRIRYIHQENRGLSAARNTGIRQARGDWVALLDADDTWHPQKTEVQLAAVEGRGLIGLIGSPASVAMPERLSTAPEVRGLSVRDLAATSLFGPSSALIRRDCFDRVGLFDERLKSVEDRDMWMRMAAHFPAVQVLSPCWQYRLHENQMNKNPGRMYDNYHKVLTKFFQEHPEHASLRGLAWGYLYFDAAVCHREAGHRFAALAFVLRSLWCWPRAFGDCQRYAPWLRPKLMGRTVLGDHAFRLLKPAAGRSHVGTSEFLVEKELLADSSRCQATQFEAKITWNTPRCSPDSAAGLSNPTCD